MAWADVIHNGRSSGLLHMGSSAAAVAKTFGGTQPVYLATPYSNEVLIDGRWQFTLSMRMQRAAAEACADFAERGVTALSPVVLATAMVHATQRFVPGRGRDACPWQHRLDPMDHALWMRWCLPIFNACDAVVVPDIPGWSRSKGVLSEVETALFLNTPVYVYAQGVEA